MIDIPNNLIFDVSPIPMWIEDLSGLKKLFDHWKIKGIKQLSPYLLEDKSRLNQCIQSINMRLVNANALQLFEANSVEELNSQKSDIFLPETIASLLIGLEYLWQGHTEFSYEAVNYTVKNNQITVETKVIILPESLDTWEKVLLITPDISQYRQAEQKKDIERQMAEGLFAHSPASLWLEDFSRIKLKLDHLKDVGIEDFRTFLDVHPEFIQQCMQDIILLDVNKATLELFGAPNKETFLQNLDTVFSGEMQSTFKEQLIELWHGHIHHRREAINYALDGSVRNVLLQFSVFPGYEKDWSRVQIALTDITARKKAESYLEYLGKHDVITKLYNRSFYIEEINRLERSYIETVSCIYLDMNGLKRVNDTLGHDSGDGLLRRMGDILRQVIISPATVSRIGGDEFVFLLPHTNAQALENIILSINELIHIDNQYYSSLPISVAIGFATREENESIEDMVKRADQHMYVDKNNYYQQLRKKSQE